MGHALLVQLRADDAQPAGDGGGAVAQVDFAGDKVEVEPLAVLHRDNALGPEDHAVSAAVQCLQRGADAFDTAAYSVRSAGEKQAEDLLRLAEYIAETTPDLTADQPADAGAGAGAGASGAGA